MSTHLSFSNAKEEFDEAWHNPAHTPIEPDPVDVNALLQKHYSTSEPLRLTKPMLRDAEAKKAWDPMTYIPRVVREGESWGRKPLENGEECFLRASQQRAWRTDVDGQVLEEVYLSPEGAEGPFPRQSGVLERRRPSSGRQPSALVSTLNTLSVERTHIL